jgi:uncharacterized protein (DUF924 family)
MTRTSAATASDSHDVLAFWFGELDASGRADSAHTQQWWEKKPALDLDIRERFAELHAQLMADEHEDWLQAPRSWLAYIIVLDQFSRNMFRDSGRAFAADARALRAAQSGIERELDKALRFDERPFAYMPLMHSEALVTQERCVQLLQDFSKELPNNQRAVMLRQIGYAERHRDIVKRFGRFPHRNALLGRDSSADEVEFVAGHGTAF